MSHPPAEIALFLLQSRIAGQRVDLASTFPAPEDQGTAREVQRKIAQQESIVSRAVRDGVYEVETGAKVYPALPDVIAADLGFLPKNPRFTSIPAKYTKNEVALFLLEEMVGGRQVTQALLERQFPGAMDQALARQVLRLFEQYRPNLEYWIRYGAENTARGAWVRPAPPHVIAGFLGLGPKDSAYKAS